MTQQTAMLIQAFLDQYKAIDAWDPRRTERTKEILPMVLEHVEGDILEIGALVGATTKVFCEIGAKHDRHVYIIDPWDGRQQGNNKIFEEFRSNTSAFTNKTVHHVGSEDPAVKVTMKATKLAFVLIDGLHTYEAVRNDLAICKESLSPGGVICIDDWVGPYAFSNDIRRATTEHLPSEYKQLVVPSTFIETYFVKS